MLPDLPKIRSKKEAAFGLKFRRWLTLHPRCSGAFELKQCKTSLPFSAVKDHQIAALMAVKNEGFLWKIADDSRGEKPFDYFYLRNEPAYIVIKYDTCFVLIDVDTFIMESKRSKGRSLLKGRAMEISTITVR